MIFFHQEGYCGHQRSQARHPAYLAGVPDALIFFCFLFLHQGKKRKWGFGGNAPNYTIDMMIMAQKVTIQVEKQPGDEDFFACYMLDDMPGFGLAGYGDTVQEAIDDLYIAQEEMKELFHEEGKAFPELAFEFRFDEDTPVPEGFRMQAEMVAS